MADRNDYFFRQRVTEAELDEGFEQLEQADKNILVDLGLTGVHSGAVVTQRDPTPDLSVDLTAPGRSYDKNGARIYWGASQNVDCSVDYNSVATTVVGVGNTKWLSLFVLFDRLLSDPRTDGNAATVYFLREESFAFKLVQGSEAVSPSRPALLADGLLLADILLAYGATEIVNGDIDTTRREDATLTLSGTPSTQFLDHVSGASDRHDAGAIDKTISPAWADGTTIAADDLSSFLDDIVDALALTTAGSEGAKKIGFGAIAAGGNPYGLAGTTTRLAISQLLSNLNDHAGTGKASAHLAANVDYAGHPTGWVDGIAIAGQTLEQVIDKIFTDLGNSGAGSGASKIGYSGGAILGVSDIASALDQIDSECGFFGEVQTWTAAQTFNDITSAHASGYKLSSRSITRRYACRAWAFDPADYAYITNPSRIEQLSTASDRLTLPLDVPNGATITNITLYLVGASGHAAFPGGAPGNMPEFQIRRVTDLDPITTSIVTGSGTYTDNSGSAGVYEAVHPITTGAVTIGPIDRDAESYHLEFYGEGGAGAIAGLRVHGVEITYTITSVDEAASS